MNGVFGKNSSLVHRNTLSMFQPSTAIYHLDRLATIETDTNNLDIENIFCVFLCILSCDMAVEKKQTNKCSMNNTDAWL